MAAACVSSQVMNFIRPKKQCQKQPKSDRHTLSKSLDYQTNCAETSWPSTAVLWPKLMQCNEESRRASWPAALSTLSIEQNPLVNPLANHPLKLNQDWPSPSSHVNHDGQKKQDQNGSCIPDHINTTVSCAQCALLSTGIKTYSDCLSSRSNVTCCLNCDSASSPTSMKQVQLNQLVLGQHRISSQYIPPAVVISDHSFPDTIQEDVDQQAKLSRRDSLNSLCSSTSSLSSLGEEDSVLETQTTCLHPKHCAVVKKSKTSPWRKVRSLVTSPFIQTYKRQKYPWIQLAGHQGNFLSGKIQGTIMKKLCGNELDCFQKLMADENLSPLVPKFNNVVVLNDESYLVLQDLLATFVNPCVMDIKMGTRTYLEEELEKAKEKPKLRKDMYEKMIAVDQDEPKPEENKQKAITKLRYMVWRETISSSSTLGFRIDGIKLANTRHKISAPIKDLKRTKSEDAVRSSILEFTCNNHKFMNIFLDKLKLIRQKLKQSEFFLNHEMIGSSLLFVHDDHHADIWMIDFAKTYPLPQGVLITHQDQWQPGNHEDGYLVGLNNLIRIFSSFIHQSTD